MRAALFLAALLALLAGSRADLAVKTIQEDTSTPGITSGTFAILSNGRVVGVVEHRRFEGSFGGRRFGPPDAVGKPGSLAAHRLAELWAGHADALASLRDRLMVAGCPFARQMALARLQAAAAAAAGRDVGAASSGFAAGSRGGASEPGFPGMDGGVPGGMAMPGHGPLLMHRRPARDPMPAGGAEPVPLMQRLFGRGQAAQPGAVELQPAVLPAAMEPGLAEPAVVGAGSAGSFGGSMELSEEEEFEQPAGLDEAVVSAEVEEEPAVGVAARDGPMVAVRPAILAGDSGPMIRRGPFKHPEPAAWVNGQEPAQPRPLLAIVWARVARLPMPMPLVQRLPGGADPAEPAEPLDMRMPMHLPWHDEPMPMPRGGLPMPGMAGPHRHPCPHKRMGPRPLLPGVAEPGMQMRGGEVVVRTAEGRWVRFEPERVPADPPSGAPEIDWRLWGSDGALNWGLVTFVALSTACAAVWGAALVRLFSHCRSVDRQTAEFMARRCAYSQAAAAASGKASSLKPLLHEGPLKAAPSAGKEGVEYASQHVAGAQRSVQVLHYEPLRGFSSDDE